jgi:hypothetical protein
VLGFDDDETWTSKNNPTGCANFLKTKNKLYDNIWYKYTPW